MNYHQARQRERDGKWAWTTMNDGRVWTSGGCVTWPEGPPTEDDLRKPMGEPHAHDTREEAERCFYDYEKGRLREFHYDGAQCPCEHSSHKRRAWTEKGLESPYLGAINLCDKHLTPEGWSVVRPFWSPIQITASW